MSNGVRRKMLEASLARSVQAARPVFRGGQATEDLKLALPRGIAREASGTIELGWYRGQQSGVYDAYKKLRNPYPEAAAYLLKQFGMDKSGNIKL